MQIRCHFGNYRAIPAQKAVEFSVYVIIMYRNDPLWARMASLVWELLSAKWNAAKEVRMKSWHSKAAALLIASQSVLHSTAVTASQATALIRDAHISLSIKGQQLEYVLQELAIVSNMSLSISGNIDGTVQASSGPKSVAGFLSELALQHGFDWWDDGKTIYISPWSERQSRLVSLRGVPLSQLKEALTALQLYQDKFALQQDTQENDNSPMSQLQGSFAY